MVQAIKHKTHVRKAQPKAASAKRKVAVKVGKSKTSVKSSQRSSSNHKKLKSRSKSHGGTFTTSLSKIAPALSKIAKEHNLEDALKSAMKAMIDKIKF